MASGWNLWVWLECIGVVSGCCCKEIYRFPHIILLIPTSLVLALFLQLDPYFFVHFLNVFCSLYIHIYLTTCYNIHLEITLFTERGRNTKTKK